MATFDLRHAFASDPKRQERFSLEAPHVFADLSKNYVDAHVQAQLIALAQAQRVEEQREALFNIDAAPLNHTQARAVGHVRLRELDAEGNGRDPAVHAQLQAFLSFATRIRSDERITDIVNIGIGGSDLGPASATLALDAFINHQKRYHFVANIDGHELHRVLRQLRPEGTLFIIASKSFHTLETLTNATTARQWFLANGGQDIARHFCAVTANTEAARGFDIETVFAFWDWVGGRFSIWSAIGLSLAIAIGEPSFRAFLRGAQDMDEHFRHAPLAQNLPAQLALIDHLYRNVHGLTSRCVVPYASALERLPAYLQQLEMESNGKSVNRAGQPLSERTSGVIWGEAGTNGQHAFFQMLHQGSDIIPVEFIAVKTPTYSDAQLGAQRQREHHVALLSNALAQAQALMQGRAHAEGHRRFAGNRPSTFLLLEALTPASLGALLALYEHRVFVCGVLWDINSFDQFGVELGKELAQALTPQLQAGGAMTDTAQDDLDASTRALLQRLKS